MIDEHRSTPPALRRRALLLAVLAVPAAALAVATLAVPSAQTQGAAQGAAQGARPDAALRAIVDGRHRTAENKVRDPYRKPFEVVRFLEIKPDSTVIEISPGAAGYWTEVLAPYVRDKGLYVAANPAPRSPAAKAGVDKYNAEFAAKLATDPASFAKIKIIDFAPELPDFAAPGSADFVLTFRNLHNWIDRGVADKALASFHRALKKGGILGIKDHRGDPKKPQDPVAQSGYIRQDYAIAMIEKAGFKFVAASEAVANPRDTRDHPAGVWALPPTYRNKDQDRAKYTAIGESDRFLLKFVKP